MKELRLVDSDKWVGSRVVVIKDTPSLDMNVGDTGKIVGSRGTYTLLYVPDRKPGFYTQRKGLWDSRVRHNGYGWWQVEYSYFGYIGPHCVFGGEHDSVHETEKAE